ncbi:MAG: hypothetical protein IPH76_18890 [Xanthomonadales bacterium]|nr:hypothetical protein [Xanthomonadales bacterium]
MPHLSGVLGARSEGGPLLLRQRRYWLALLMAGAVSPLRGRAATVAARC